MSIETGRIQAPLTTAITLAFEGANKNLQRLISVYNREFQNLSKTEALAGESMSALKNIMKTVSSLKLLNQSSEVKTIVSNMVKLTTDLVEQVLLSWLMSRILCKRDNFHKIIYQ